VPIPSALQPRANGSPASALKRKLPSSTSTPNAAGAAQTPSKKQRREDHTSANQATPSSLKKSVSFADGTKDSAADKTTEKKKPKKKKTKKAAAAPKADFSLEPSLNYLRQWHTARESWKFNKNHQTLLIKYLFDEDKIPSSDVSIFYQYIRDLKGFVRTRLRETAAEIKQKDMEAGAGAFPATLRDKKTKQKEYEDTISRFLQDLQQHQQQQQQPNGKPSKNANGKRSLDEVEYVLRVATPEVKHRLLKRIRAERVLEELSSSDSEESTTSAASAGTATSSTSSSSASSGQEAATATGTATAALNGGGTRGRSDSSLQPAKRRRLRNVRTDIGDEDSSSSESESSESESEEESSSSSESEDGSDEEMVDAAPDGDAAESSSSSSSSSSSEGESESEVGNGAEEESESESSSSDED
jgi:hypothetical protein